MSRQVSRIPRRVRVLGVAALALLLIAVAAVVGIRVWRATHRTDLQTAMALAPSGAERFSFTDWAGVRRELGAQLDPGSSADAVDDFLSRAFDRDLSSASAMVSSAGVLQDDFGFSPGTVEWELFAQGQTGAAVLMSLPDDVDTDALGDGFEGLGYTRPDSADGVWVGGDEVISRIAGARSLSPEFQYLAIDAGKHLLVASDTADYAGVAAKVARGDGASVAGLDDVVAAAGDAVSASVYTGDNVCRALAMSQADDSDQAQADALIAQAGDIDPLTGFATSALPDGRILVAMGFASADQARDNADSRAALASGPAVGQGGDFADRFRLRRTTARGDVVILDLDPRPGTYVLSDLATGPVLYATC